MAIFSISDIRMAGLSACVPPKTLSNHDYKWIKVKEREQVIKTIGVENRHVAEPGQTTSDLCFQAAEQLLGELKWDRNEISILVFVSQSRDYIIPSTSAILQDRLKLPKSCMAIDINLGCSGYVYGLSVIGSMMKAAGLHKGLLLVGDLSNVTSSYRDKSTYPLFGDAGTATALELDPGAAPMQFNLQTDGSGYEAIIIYDGGVRNLASKKSFATRKYGEGIYRNRLQIALNGIEVFNFSLREVVPNIKTTLKHFGRELPEFDYLLFHQANRLINETIRKMLKVEPERVPYSLRDFGNTSCASIPLTMVTQIREALEQKPQKLLLSAFGIGLSWGSVLMETSGLVVPPLTELEPASQPGV
ncbi:ketoacyl-ACP synthase III [Lentimicrobium sp.]|uniref:3-oxoacyl-ACP synthase III family protein n=3 Tax=Lentimicrobium sp. TaxID=2034841 RepID=UPI002B5EA5D4|nr:ketoacyl-ACP synthase III [Lentimicrobium sp.]HPJ63326.1 ketoacyl-ACP synthase III [Lentimicrobium sp.]